MSSETTIDPQPNVQPVPHVAAVWRQTWGRPRWRVSVAVIALLAGAAVTLITRWGAGLSPDSVTYLRMADLFERGGGLITPSENRGLATSHYPPMYPLTVAAVNLDGMRLRHTARWMNVFLVVVNVSLVGALAWRATGRTGAAIAASALAASNMALLEVHAWVWTEPMFLAWTMAALLLLSAAIARPQSSRLLVAAALATAAAAVTRYAGMSLIAAGALAIVLLRRDSWRTRLLDAGAFLLIAAMPLAMWMIRNAFLFKTTVNRELRWLGYDRFDLDHLARTFNVWTLPLQRATDLKRAAYFAVPLLIGVAVLAVAGATYVRRRARIAPVALPADATADGVSLRRLLALFAVSYFGLVAVTICFLDSSTPFDTRILSPVYIPALIGAIVVASRVAEAGRRGAWAVCAGLLLLIGVNVYASYMWGDGGYDRGLGFAMRRWAESPILGHVARLPRETRIYTNVPELVEAHLYRNALILPRPFNVATRSASNYDDGLKRIAETLRTSDTVVVWFNKVPRNAQYESERTIIKKLNLIRVARSKDGAMYRGIGAPTQPATRPAPAPEPSIEDEGPIAGGVMPCFALPFRVGTRGRCDLRSHKRQKHLVTLPSPRSRRAGPPPRCRDGGQSGSSYPA